MARTFYDRIDDASKQLYKLLAKARLDEAWSRLVLDSPLGGTGVDFH